jgi:hypothetical protein
VIAAADAAADGVTMILPRVVRRHRHRHRKLRCR